MFPDALSVMLVDGTSPHLTSPHFTSPHFTSTYLSQNILDAVSAAKLRALEKELWNAASALVFRTEERDDAKQVHHLVCLHHLQTQLMTR